MRNHWFVVNVVSLTQNLINAHTMASFGIMSSLALLSKRTWCSLGFLNDTFIQIIFAVIRHSLVSLFLSQLRIANRKIVKMPADLLHPSAELELRTHKLKRLVQSPNSFFMDIKCPGCFQITTVFSHAQTVVLCGNCNIMLCQPTGGRARLTEGCSYRKKVD